MYKLLLQATGDIDTHFQSRLMEPRLIVFHDIEKIVQMFIAAENDSILEVPSSSFKDGLVQLMAAYYVYNVQYPAMCKSILFFLQDVVMDKPDAGSRNRPTRYSSYLARLQK